MIVSRMFRIAEFDLKISSRKTSCAVGSLPSFRRMYRPSRSSLMSIAPMISLGSVNRVSMYSK